MLRVDRCGIHGIHETIGIDTDELRFFWVLQAQEEEEAGEVTEQAAYRIILSTDKGVFMSQVNGSLPEWDSGRVEGNTQRDVLCRLAEGFASTTFYYWRVTVWDQHGRESHGPVQEFYTSYTRSSRLLPPYSMNQTYMPHTSLIFRTWFEDEPNRWKAIWLGDGGDKPIYLRKDFRLSEGKGVNRVVVLASGLGHFNLRVNGAPASQTHVLDPGWTDYHRTVQFVGYDITSLIKADTTNSLNTIAAHVGNGFYAGDKGGPGRFFWPTYEDNTYVRYGNELCFFAEIHVHYEDGTHETVISDSTWLVRRSATTLANIYASEDHDRRLFPTGWDTPGFDPGADVVPWEPARPVTGPRGKLKYQSQPPVVLLDALVPIRQDEVRPGVLVYDLGQNSSIMVRVEASGPAGSTYLVKYSETLGEDGLVLMPDPLFKEFETGVYSKVTLAGRDGGREIWEPDFSFTCARYIQIEGAVLGNDDGDDDNNNTIDTGRSTIGGENQPVTIHSLTARHISSAARRLGYVKTDVEDVNALINTCKWSFSSNLFSYHTDCPQIEKFAWLEVTHLLAPATQYARDMESLYSKILLDIMDAQEPDGLVPTMAPLMRYMCGPMHNTITWGGALCLIPGHLKHYYGSTGVFSRVYASCVRYLEYMKERERKGGLIEHGLGDWGRDIAYGNHQANIETAIYYQCLRNVEMMARELGKREDEQRFGRWATRIYNVYNDRLLVTDKKEYPHVHYTSLDTPGTIDRTMVAQAMALTFGLVPEAHRRDVMAAFLAAAEASDYTMLAGEIGLKYLWDVLALPEVDRPDIVLAMARREEHPSYMRFLRRGETTLSEFWQDACRSKSHDMLGTIYQWFYEAVLGVRPSDEPGREAYRAWSLRPPFTSEFQSVQGEVDCPYGLIRVQFERRKGTGARVELQVPVGTTCDVLLPREKSKIRLRKIGGAGEIEASGKRVELRHGQYILDIDI